MSTVQDMPITFGGSSLKEATRTKECREDEYMLTRQKAGRAVGASTDGQHRTAETGVKDEPEQVVFKDLMLT